MAKDDKLPLKLISLVISLLLFFSVNESFTSFFTQTDESNNTTTWIRDVPIEVNYDKEKYYILGIPDSVDVKLTGIPARVQKESVDRKFKVQLDFSNVSIGDDQKIKVEIVDLDSSLKAVSDPEVITVSVRNRVSKEFTISPTVKNERLLLGHSINSISLSDEKVIISGAEETINNIYAVRAESVTKTKISGNIREEAKIVAYDRNFNKIEDIEMDKTTTTLTISVSNIEKTLKVNVNQIGELPPEYEIDKITVEPESVILKMESDTELASVNEVFVDFEMSTINKETTELTNLKVYAKTDSLYTIESPTVKVTVKVKRK